MTSEGQKGRKLDHAEVLRLYADGEGATAIAERFGVTRQAVYYVLTHNGIDPASRSLTGQQTEALQVAARAVRKLRAAQTETRALIRAALAAGVPVTTLASQTGWARETIRKLAP